MIFTGISYWKVFRLIFVIFSLYLLADVLYRWNGFRYYGSLSEFLPCVALITILWSILAAFTALLLCLPIRTIEWVSVQKGWKIKADHLLLFTGVFVLLGATVWFGKRFLLSYEYTTFQLQKILFFLITFTAILLTWVFRNKAELWMGKIQDFITLQVWLFGIIFVLSFPLLAYHTWGKQTDNAVSQELTQSLTKKRDRPNILFVIFDTLAARDMSVYGYHRLTTPFINKWAKSAAIFTNIKSASNLTLSTSASFMTGKRVWTHQTYQAENASKPVRGNIENLPLVLKNNGYYTMAFVVPSPVSVKSLGIAESFDIAKSRYDLQMYYYLRDITKFLYNLFGDKIRIYDWLTKEDFILSKIISKISRDFKRTKVSPKEAFNRFLAVIDNNPPEPFFAWIHVLPPGNPYLPPEPFMGMFDSSPEMRTFKSQEGFRVKRGWSVEFKKEDQATINILRARYDGFIRYCDKQFENFIEQLIKRDKLKNTVLILSSDHGESFEHNYFMHAGPHLYEQVTHIPLIIKEPSQTEGRIINDLVEQIDIPATILSLAGISVPSWMEGRSLMPLMRGKKFSSRPAFSMSLYKNPSRGHQITKGTIAVWEGDYKLIYYLEDEKSLLFNLREDPDELNNLIDREPEISQHLLTLIKDNLKKANERIDSGI